MRYFQQGDVLLKRVATLPSGVRLADSLVLQHGETTGHMHQFRASDAYRVAVYTAARPADSARVTTLDETKYVVVGSAVCLYHEEHKPIEVPPGIYEMDIVREWDYDANEVARVVD